MSGDVEQVIFGRTMQRGRRLRLNKSRRRNRHGDLLDVL